MKIKKWKAERVEQVLEIISAVNSQTLLLISERLYNELDKLATSSDFGYCFNGQMSQALVHKLTFVDKKIWIARCYSVTGLPFYSVVGVRQNGIEKFFKERSEKIIFVE